MFGRWKLSPEIGRVHQCDGDLSVALLRGSTGSASVSAELLSVRRVYEYVGCSAILQPGNYTLIPLSFNHFHTSSL